MSDSPTAPSGYGNVTRFVCSELAESGYDVSLIGWQTHGRPRRWQGCRLYSAGKDPFGADVLLRYLRHIQPDVLVTQADSWRLSFVANPVIPGFLTAARIPWVIYSPIDSDCGHGRLPPGLVRLLQQVDIPVTVSQYGAKVMRTNGLQPVVIPYGVDTALFRPARPKSLAKRAFGYEGRFVILTDARNQPPQALASDLGDRRALRCR